MDYMKKKIIITIIIILILILGVVLLSLNSLDSDSYDWENDGIVLMQHETEGSYNCFGCSEPGEGPAMCIDPIMEMKLVDETVDRYCDSEFSVVS